MALFFSILLISYLVIGVFVVFKVFKKHIKEAEKEDSPTGIVCNAIVFLVLLWPFAWKISKRIS